MQLEKFSEDLYKANNKIQEFKNINSSIKLSPAFLSEFQDLKKTNFNELKSSIRTYLFKLDSEKTDQIFKLLINDINEFISFFEKHREILTTYRIDKKEHNLFWDSAKIATAKSSRIWSELYSISNLKDSIYYSPGISDSELNIKIDHLRKKEILLQKEYDMAKAEAEELNKLSEKRNKELAGYNIPFQNINRELKMVKSELASNMTSKEGLNTSATILNMRICTVFTEHFNYALIKPISELTFFKLMNMNLNDDKFEIKKYHKGTIHFLIKYIRKFVSPNDKEEWQAYVYSHLNNIENNTSNGKKDDTLISDKHVTFKENFFKTIDYLNDSQNERF